jgi:hypothetical protein
VALRANAGDTAAADAGLRALGSFVGAAQTTGARRCASRRDPSCWRQGCASSVCWRARWRLLRAVQPGLQRRAGADAAALPGACTTPRCHSAAQRRARAGEHVRARTHARGDRTSAAMDAGMIAPSCLRAAALQHDGATLRTRTRARTARCARCCEAARTSARAAAPRGCSCNEGVRPCLARRTFRRFRLSDHERL